MSKSLLDHAFGIRGYDYQATRLERGQVVIVIRQPGETLSCAACGSRRVFSQGRVCRRFRAVPIGKTPVEIELGVPRFSAGPAVAQPEQTKRPRDPRPPFPCVDGWRAVASCAHVGN